VVKVDGEVPAFRWPSLRRPMDIFFLLACVLLSADVLVPEIFGHGKTKDYILWHWAGQQVVHGAPLYESTDSDGGLRFLYPPFAALLLALPSWFGKIPFYLGICIINSVAWTLTSQICNAMASPTKPIPAKPLPDWLAALPSIALITFIFDMYDLGQPNLLLLSIMLLGFWTIQNKRPWIAGGLFALATAIKVFPLAVLPYLLWRRQWAASVSMIVFTLLFLYVVPAPFRGFERNAAEMQTWSTAMIGSNSEKGFGQRDAQNWSSINQSIVAITHRLVRSVNYVQDDPKRPPAYMNVIDVDYATANIILLAVCGLLGLGFVVSLRPLSALTQRAWAEELGVLFCLMTVASPLARQYYFIWLFLPLTVLVHRAADDIRPQVRIGTCALICVAFGLMLLSFPIFPVAFQAWGNNFWATVLLGCGLIWHMHHPPVLLDCTQNPNTPSEGSRHGRIVVP
jgi:hypothetical protein